MPKTNKDNKPYPLTSQADAAITLPNTTKQDNHESPSHVTEILAQVTKIQAKEETVAPPIIPKLKPTMTTQARHLLLSVFNPTKRHKDLA